MRRRLLVGLALALGVLLTPGVAHADPEEEFRECMAEFAEEEAESLDDLVVDGEFVPACELEENNPILPAEKELIWGSLSFIVLFALLAKFAYPPVKQAMVDRTQKIQDEVDAAEAAQAAAAAKEAEYEAKLAEARQEAARILEQARQDADAYRGEKRTEADAEVGRLREQALADIEASKAQALADMKAEVATLAINAAEQVVGRSLDRDANVALVEQFIDGVGSGSTN